LTQWTALFCEVRRIMPILQSRYDVAVGHYRDGHFELAWAELEPVLATSDVHPDVLNLAAICAMRLDRFQDAKALLQRAVIVRPDDAGLHGNLGNVLTRLEEYEEALIAYRRALEIEPANVQARFNLSLSHMRQERWSEAEIELLRTVELSGDFADAHGRLGNVFEALTRPSDALACYEHVLRLRPDDETALRNLLRITGELNLWDRVEQRCRDAIKCRPDLGWLRHELGLALEHRDALDDAVEAYREAIALDPNVVEALNNLGILMLRMERPFEAESALRTAVELRPDNASLLCTLASVLSAQGRLEASEAMNRQALALEADHANARFDLALLLLSQGRYEEGWLLYESRLDLQLPYQTFSVPAMDFPQWRGESLCDKRIIVFAEQGLGDGIQFSRYFPLLKARGAAHVTVVCRAPLVRLLANMKGVDHCIDQERGGDISQHDYWCFTMSLPLRFGTTLDSIPSSVPYLSPLPGQAEIWRRRLPDGAPKVGLVWAGDPRASVLQLNEVDRRRSLCAAMYSPLLEIPGITFVSLQKGEVSSAQIADLPVALQPFDPMQDVTDFADTAAILASLDLVISVDTSTAHLAGAMNVPVWILSRDDGCWRWLRDRDDSPWYPSARLFRQRRAGEWDEVLARLADELRVWAEQRAIG
jgi:tetratricopeptide (TPR) repeat protein